MQVAKSSSPTYLEVPVMREDMGSGFLSMSVVSRCSLMDGGERRVKNTDHYGVHLVAHLTNHRSTSEQKILGNLAPVPTSPMRTLSACVCGRFFMIYRQWPTRG